MTLTAMLLNLLYRSSTGKGLYPNGLAHNLTNAEKHHPVENSEMQASPALWSYQIVED